MAADQQAEVLLAQRLASNEKPVRTRAMKKLRKYVSVRSQQAVFSGEELLKLWKGLFYCLWMQDKPLLQEELSRQISTLIHGFHTSEQQLSYLQSFLQTMQREWTGIDQLRMDKFFQLVRFMFRQALEALRRRSWDSSVVSQFLELLSAQLLQSDGAAPSGLQLHVLDLYLTELAAVGAAELTADQNLTFIEPFCRTAARTKDRTLFSSICSSIFSAIIDQAPFAIEDLMKEVKAAEDSDSGQASDEEEPGEEDTRKMEGGKKQVNGTKKSDEEEEEEEDEEEFLHLENLDSDSPYDEDVGPVLQFDYSALADKLLEFSSQSGTPGPNRQRLYKIVKILRDLSEGVFPQDEYPEEVSTDEDDDMFGSRKRMKRRRHAEEGEEAGPVVKKGKKKEEDAADVSAENKKKKKKKKKREEQPEQTQTQTAEEAAAPALKATDHKDQHKKKKEAPPTSEPAGAPASEKSSGITGTCEVLGKEMTAASPSESDATTPAKKRRKRKKKKADGSAEQTQTAAEEAGTVKVTETALGSEAATQPDRQDQPTKKKHKNTDTPPTAEPDLSEKQKKKKKKGAAAEETRAPPEREAATPAKKKEKKKKAAAEGQAPLSAGMDGTPATGSDATTPAKKKKSITADEEQAAEVPQLAKKKTKKKGTREATTDPTPAETPQKKKKDQRDAPEEEEGRQEANAGMTPAKKKKKSRKQVAGEVVDSNAEATVKKKKRKIPVVFEFEADELQAANGLAEEEETAAKKPRRTNVEAAALQRKQQGGGGSPSAFVTFQSKAKAPTPLFWKVKGSPSTPASVRKKFQTPKSDSKKVTFGLKNNKTAEFRKSDRSLLVSPDGSSRVPFDPQQKPKFGVLKSPPTPLSATVKKTPIRRKKGGAAPQTTPTRRAVASDFF